METYRVEAVVEAEGTLTLTNLPFKAGESVEVIILGQPLQSVSKERYPLRGTSVTYIDPMEPVAEADWEALQ